MNKLLCILSIVTFISLGAKAQTGRNMLSIGADLGLATGQANQVYSSVFGASFKLELPVAKSDFNVTVTAAYSAFIVKSAYNGFINSGAYIPLELGGKYYFAKVAYFEGDLGVSLNANGAGYNGPKAAFIYAPIIGVSAPTNNHKAAIDLGLRYEGRVESGGTLSQVALRIAYKFGI